jgi:aspartate/methionine/tyrosine aminotransferase
VYEGAATFPQSLKEGFERSLVVDSLSKSFSMTGWRLGYLATPGGVARNFVKFLQHSVYCVPAFIQAAGVRALELKDDLVPGYRNLFQTRMRRATDKLRKTPGIACGMPPASMHLFPSVAGDEVAIARRWLEDLHVAVLPGTAFGAAGAGFVRISLTCPDDQIDLALDRIQQAGV